MPTGPATPCRMACGCWRTRPEPAPSWLWPTRSWGRTPRSPGTPPTPCGGASGPWPSPRDRTGRRPRSWPWRSGGIPGARWATSTGSTASAGPSRSAPPPAGRSTGSWPTRGWPSGCGCWRVPNGGWPSSTRQWTRASDLGRWDEVLTVAGEVRALDRQAGGTQVSALVLAAEVPVLIHRGRAGDGAALVEDMQVEAAAGDGDEVGRLAEEFQRATTDRSTLYRQVHGPELIRACVAAGHLDLAERLAADPPGLSAREAAASATARAVVALARDRLEDAATGFADCETRWTAYGHRLESALAALGSARALFGLGRSEEAEERLGAAREAFESLGAIDLTAQAETIAGAPQA